MAEYWDRERGRRYRSEGYYGGYYGHPERESGRRDERGFFDRAGDEVRSWFGDEEAQRRRSRDEREMREDERRWGGPRDSERGWGGGRDDEPSERDWARRWGYIDSREARGGERDARGWGYSGGYGAGAGFAGAGGREWLGGGYEPGSWTDPERYGGSRSFTRSRGAAGGPHAGRGPRGYQRSDERIREDICERMCENGALDASDIEVRVSNAEVTLMGTVRDRDDKRLAEDLADQVSGVRDVHNEIRVSQQGADPNQQQQQQRYRIA
jgi:osmotically-inducible protein OsmY